MSGSQIDGLIRAMSRLLRGEPSPPASVDLAALVRAALDRHDARRLAAGVVLRRVGLERPAWLEGDADLLAIACTNLLRNTLEALESAPPPRRLLVALEREPGTLRLRLEDSGAGLPALRCRELLLNSTSADGMGLGLLTTQAIAQRHGGELQLGRSDELGGAAVSLRLAAEPRASAAGDRSPPDAPARAR